MAQGIIVVKAAHDPEAGVWFVETSDLPGLNAEAATLEQLIEAIPAAVRDLIDEGGFEGIDASQDVPIELIAHASTRVRIAA